MYDSYIETAARKLCALQGVDPDSLVGHGAEPDERGLVPLVWLQSPAWTRVAPRILAHLKVREALEHADIVCGSAP